MLTLGWPYKTLESITFLLTDLVAYGKAFVFLLNSLSGELANRCDAFVALPRNWQNSNEHTQNQRLNHSQVS